MYINVCFAAEYPQIYSCCVRTVNAFPRSTHNAFYFHIYSMWLTTHNLFLKHTFLFASIFYTGKTFPLTEFYNDNFDEGEKA